MAGYVMPTYGRLNVSFERGEGAWLWDQNNKRYLDAISGIAVCNLGHAHPAISRAISDQSSKLIHTSNLYNVALQEELAHRLINLSGMDNVFFGNSGAEANEAAIKLARRYGHHQNIEKPAIIVTEKSFHGRTLATLSATGNTKIQQGFEPLVEGFIRVPYNNLDAIKNEISRHDNIVAILIEPIQGEGGVNIPAPEYLDEIRRICDENGLLMMLDEIQTGMGRTGKMFAFQHNQIVPDVCTLAKALGNGVPIGACMAKGKAAEILTAGTHGSTFGGNPLACRAALTVLDILEQDNLLGKAQTTGSKIVENLKTALKNQPLVCNIRNKGMMIGIDLSRPCQELIGEAMEKSVLINVTYEKTIRLLPPLIFEQEHVDMLTGTLSELIENLANN